MRLKLPRGQLLPDEQIPRVFNYYIMGDAYGIVDSAHRLLLKKAKGAPALNVTNFA